VRLEPEVLDFLATRAKQRRTTVNQLVNQLLKKDMELIQAAAG
jgi:predicted HicB family RNase H-like nuclease